MTLSVEQIKDAASNIIPKYSIKKMILFGSYASDTANDESDVDFIVEFEQAAVSLFMLSDLKYDLEEVLGKPVDVIHGPLPEESLIEINKVVSLYE
jgi:predicted nucleotidyltransferase